MADTKLQINVDFTNAPELFEALEKMAADDYTDRSKMIRKLVAQEIARRQQLELPHPTKQSKTRKEPAALAA